VLQLEGPALLEAASKATGLTDFGDPGFREGLTVLVRSFKEDAWPTIRPDARPFVAPELVNHLIGRLKVVADRARYPEIADVVIERPFVIVGMGRTGTTLIHTLLAQDPQHIAPPHWAVLQPSPPPRMGGPTSEQLAAAEKELHAFLDRVPQLRIQHSYFVEEGASAFAECGEILKLAFTCQQYGTYYTGLSGYIEWVLGECDHVAGLRFHRQFLQHLLWGRDDHRWVLKGADYAPILAALVEVYPDADLIWTHRDLGEWLSSNISVTAHVQELGGYPIDDLPAYARDRVAYEKRRLCRGMELRDRIGEERFFDLSYHDLMADPLGSVRRVYERFGRAFTSEAEAGVRDWLVRNPQTKHGKHDHSAGRSGLDPDTINRQFAGYRERFGHGFADHRA
jgi:hypothetical protein